LDKGGNFGLEGRAIAIVLNRQATDFLGDFEGVFGIFEGFRVSVLAIHKQSAAEIGVKTVFAQTEVKIEVFGWGKLGIVPSEGLGEQITIDHDARMLDGVLGVHELVNAKMGSWEDLFTGDFVVFVDGKALATHNNYARVSLEVLDLFLEAGGHSKVVCVHAGYKVAFGLGETEIEGIGDPLVVFITIDVETGVDFGEVF